jgi:hypothetical protein
MHPTVQHHCCQNQPAAAKFRSCSTTTDAGGSRGTIPFWQPAGQSCVRSGGWTCGGSARPRERSGERRSRDRLVIAADFTDAADHPAVLQAVRQASRRRPRPPSWQTRRSAAGRPGVAVLNRVEPVVSVTVWTASARARGAVAGEPGPSSVLNLLTRPSCESARQVWVRIYLTNTRVHSSPSRSGRFSRTHR